MNHRVRISETQFTLAATAAFGELGLLTSPRDLVSAAGREAIVALLLAIALAAGFVLPFVRLGLMFPRMTPIEYAKLVLGRFLGTIAAVWMVGFHVILAAMCLRYYGDLVNSVYLPRTPIEITMLLLAIVAVFVVWHGTESTMRFVGLIYPVILALVVTTTGFGVLRGREFLAVVPSVPRDIPAVLSGAWQVMYAFVGAESVTMLLPFVNKPRHPYRNTFVAVALNGGLLLVVLVASLSVFGLEPLAYLHYPGVAFLRVLRLAGLLIERWGSFVGFLWIFLKLSYVCFYFWGTSLGTAQLFGLGLKEAPYFLFPVALLTFVVAAFPRNPSEFETYIHQFIVPLGIWSNLGMALLLMAVGRLRGLGTSP